MRNFLKKLFFIFMFLTPLFSTAFTNRNVQKQFPHFGNLHHCKHSVHYPDQDLLLDIQQGTPYYEALIVFDNEENKVMVLRDNSGNIPLHQWLENVHISTDEPGNPYFSQYQYSHYLDIESLSFRLRSVEFLNCLCSYREYTASDSFGISYPCLRQHNQNNRFFIYKVSYF